MLQYQSQGEIKSKGGKWVLPGGGLPPQNHAMGESIADAVEQRIQNCPKSKTVALICMEDTEPEISDIKDLRVQMGRVKNRRWVSDNDNDDHPLVYAVKQAMQAKAHKVSKQAHDKTSTAGQPRIHIRHKDRDKEEIKAPRASKKRVNVVVNVEPEEMFEPEIDKIMEDKEIAIAAWQPEEPEKTIAKAVCRQTATPGIQEIDRDVMDKILEAEVDISVKEAM
jgi:hypothetical protein